MSDDSILKDGDWVVMDMQEKGVIATLEEINLPKRIPLKMAQSVFCGDKDVELVMSQTLATEEKAREALTIKRGDVVEAIMYIQDKEVERHYVQDDVVHMIDKIESLKPLSIIVDAKGRFDNPVYSNKKDIERVISQTNATEEKAREALDIQSGDPFKAIMYLMDREVEDSYIRRKDETNYVQKKTGCTRNKAKQVLRKAKGDVTLAISSLMNE